jgi:HK97 family phage prohead protease
MEYKSVEFEVKDLSPEKRTAVIAHAHYGNIDITGDISTKGMFTSSWERKSAIDFYFNHDPSQIPGNVIRTFEDEQKAYTEVKFGNWKLGDDMIAMIDAKVIRGASFGFVTEKKEFKEVKGKKVRVLRQVDHLETSLLTKTPANPLTGVISLTKDADIKNLVIELKAHVATMENFCRNTRSSDETIKAIMSELKQANDILSKYDTASTPLITDGGASRNDSDKFRKQLLLITSNL